MLDGVLERITMTSALWAEILTWRNDPLVYVWNRTNRFINLDEHMFWFEKRKSNLKHEPIFAYLDETSFIGTARLDRASLNAYEIGIIVNPRFRGLGFGKAILGDICAYLSTEKWNSFDVLAYVHEDNTSSRYLFESFNFVPKSRVGHFVVFQWIRPGAPNLV